MHAVINTSKNNTETAEGERTGDFDDVVGWAADEDGAHHERGLGWVQAGCSLALV